MANENRPDEDLGNVGTRKPDDAVGSRGPQPAGGGRQTPEQAAITGQGAGQEAEGRSDTERREDWAGKAPATRPSPTPGGSSGGHSDRIASSGPRESEPVAGSPERAKRS